MSPGAEVVMGLMPVERRRFLAMAEAASIPSDRAEALLIEVSRDADRLQELRRWMRGRREQMASSNREIAYALDVEANVGRVLVGSPGGDE